MFVFDINFVLFTILDYPVSLVELIGTVFGMLCVWLTAKEKVICWPIGLVNIVFFFIMFYQVRLYSDMLLQIYFFVMTIYGWWKWTHPAEGEHDKKAELKISGIQPGRFWFLLGATAFAIVVTGTLMRYVHIWIPFVFPEPAAFPYADAFTTVLSIVATVLMAVKKRECWYFWIAVDIVATVVYFMKGIHLVAIEYIIFGMIAFSGFLTWRKIEKKYAATGASVLSNPGEQEA